MKTIKDLEEIIKESGGVFQIGGLMFEQSSPDADIDVKIAEELVMWFSNTEDKNASLNDAEVYSLSGKFTESGKKRAQEKRAKLTELEEQNTELIKKAGENVSAVGKVEAYEKLLLGRTVSLGQ